VNEQSVRQSEDASYSRKAGVPVSHAGLRFPSNASTGQRQVDGGRSVCRCNITLFRRREAQAEGGGRTIY